MKTAHDLVVAAKAHVHEISLEQAATAIADPACYLIDVREPDEYAAGHLQGAINIPRGLLEFKIADLTTDANRALVVYCKTSGRAALSACALQALGYQSVQSIAGGFDAWVQAELPVFMPKPVSFE